MINTSLKKIGEFAETARKHASGEINLENARSHKDLQKSFKLAKADIGELKKEISDNDPSFNIEAIDQAENEVEQSLKDLEQSESAPESTDTQENKESNKEKEIDPDFKDLVEVQEEQDPDQQLHKAQKAVVAKNEREDNKKPETEEFSDGGLGGVAADVARNTMLLIKKLVKALLNAVIKLLNLASQAMGKPLDIKPLDNSGKFGMRGAGGDNNSPAGAGDIESPEEIKEQRRGFLENMLTSKGNQIRQDLPKNLDNGMPAKEALASALNCHTEALNPDSLKFPIDKKDPLSGKETLSDLMDKANKDSPNFDSGAEKRLQAAMKTKAFKDYRKAFEEQNKAVQSLGKMMKDEGFNKLVDNNPELQKAIKDFKATANESGQLADKANNAYKKHFGSQQGGFFETVKQAKEADPMSSFESNKEAIAKKNELKEHNKVDSSQDFKKKKEGMKMG